MVLFLIRSVNRCDSPQCIPGSLLQLGRQKRFSREKSATSWCLLKSLLLQLDQPACSACCSTNANSPGRFSDGTLSPIHSLAWCACLVSSSSVLVTFCLVDVSHEFVGHFAVVFEVQRTKLQIEQQKIVSITLVHLSCNVGMLLFHANLHPLHRPMLLILLGQQSLSLLNVHHNLRPTPIPARCLVFSLLRPTLLPD